MNFLNAMKKGKHIRRKSKITDWENIGYSDYWYSVKELYKKGLMFFGIDIEDILANDWEVK